MASTNYEKKYNPTNLLISDNGKTWDNWNNQSGTNVQEFIKGELEKAIVDFEYDENSILWGVNSLGERVVKAEVNVVKPSYHFNDADKSMAVYLNGSTTAISGTTYNVNANSSLTAQVKFNWNLVQVVNKKENEFTANAVNYRAFLINPATGDKYKSNGLEISGQASYSAAGFKLDITKLLTKNEIPSGTVKVRVIVSYSFMNDANAIENIDCIIDSDTRLNVKRIELTYPPEAGILSNPTITFGLSGILAEDAPTFKLQYGVLVNGKSVSGNQPIDASDISQINFNVSNVAGAITKDVQTVNLCARVINNDSSLFSDWVTVSALYQSNDTVVGQSGATVAISHVPEYVNNCDSANLFNVLTTDKMQGEITVYVYKSSTKSAIQNIQTTDKGRPTYYKDSRMMVNLFKTINLSLNGAEVSTTEKYFSYLEMEGITDDNNTIYLAFVVQTGSDESNAEVSTFCIPGSTGTILAEKVRAITITNPKNASELMHVTEGKIIDYSQIAANKKFIQNGEQKELFDSSNLHENIDSTDGMTQDGKYMGFKISPLGMQKRTSDSYEAGDPSIEPTPEMVPINLFKNPVKLQNAGGTLLPNTNEFSIELLLKTYNVNDDDDFILSIGNLRLYPHYLRLWSQDLGYEKGELEFSKPFVASCANFSKDEVTHIMITFDKRYKPKQYEDIIYKDLYPGFEKTAENGGPETSQCLKIYINGVINRSISIDSSQLLDYRSDFSLQIHPTNSNINIYGFRTYNKCLTYDQIQKNRISAFASLDDEKLPFLEVNDLVHKASDYVSDRWTQIYNAGLANTISIKKCLGMIDEGYADKTKKYTPKNVMLIVTDEEGPLYYGNKKFTDPKDSSISQKYHDAAMFIKYAHNNDQANEYASTYNGKFVGIYLAHENGYDEYYKAQGSSAKRYGGAYNVQFSKFYFIPETKLAAFSKLVDNKYYDAAATKDWEEIPVQDEATGNVIDTTYKTNVKLDFEATDYLMKVVEKDGKKSYKAGDTTYPESYNTVMEKLASKSYTLPTDGSKAPAAKLVGKVNYASSMQSHKQGACDLYAGCYPSQDKDYMKRRAVKEDVFYYFYIKRSDCIPTADQSEVTFRNVTWDNINWDKVRFFGIQTWGSAKMDKPTFGLDSKKDLEYLNIEGADNKNASTNFKCPWAAQQIWDNSELTERDNPYYSSIAGKYATPEDYVNQYAGYDMDGTTKVPNYVRGLLIDDETIRYKKPSVDETTKGKDAIEMGPDSWDVAGNAVKESQSAHFVFTKWGDEFVDINGVQHKKETPIIKSFSSFARLYNYIYSFDFGNLALFGDVYGDAAQTLDTSVPGISESKKYIITYAGDLITKKKTYKVNVGDVFRWDQVFETFVPAGLYYDQTAGDWETFNLGVEYDAMKAAVVENDTSSKYWEVYSTALANFTAYTNTEDPDFFNKPSNLITKRDVENHYFQGTGSEVDNLGNIDQRDATLEMFRGALADMFKCAIWAYCDVNSFAYHQAAIRFLSGTDNRAKNIYFVLKGDTYKKMTGKAYKLDENGSRIPLESGDGYETVDKTYYIVDPNQTEYKNRHLWTLFQDDLDTIFATDNNGQQSKDYNLLEPIYNNETIGNWGDSRSGLWYNFDLVFEDQIRHHLKRIVDWSISSSAAGNGPIYNESNNLYKSFLKIQKEIIPAITYNHMSEIYYDTMQTIYKGGKVTPFGQSIKGFNDGVFNNNLVSNPESLVHGGCLESEKQFLKKRVALLASYCSDFTSEDNYSAIKPLGKTGGGDQLKIYMKMKDLSFIQDFYPNILGNSINDLESRTYADPIILTYNPPAYLTALSRSGDKYEINRFELASGLTSRDSIQHTDYYKTVTFTEGVSSVAEFSMNNVSELRYEEPDYLTPEEYEQFVYKEGADGYDNRGINFVPINTDETKPILYLDKIIKNVEVLDAPYSRFNKATIDISQCQRLRELNLSFATSSVPISNILLPKSNKLARVTIPSNIQQISIEYYPGIKHFEVNPSQPENERSWFAFDSENVNLTSITIDLRNTWALEFLEKYAKRGTVQNIVFKNTPAELDINVSLLTLLLDLPKFDFDSKVKLNISGNVSMILKEKMAKRWNNVDDASNKIYCTYTKVPAQKINWDDASPTIGATGQTVGFNVVSFEELNANDIKIANNRLQIDYTMTSVQGITVDKTTGEFKITQGASIQDKSTTLTVRIYKTDGSSITSTTPVYFGAYKPAPGDIVYSDGSIGKSLNSNKTPIGFIFWTKKLDDLSTESKETYDIRILAFDSLKSVNRAETQANISTGLPFGPCGSLSSSQMLSYGSYGTLSAQVQDAVFRMFNGTEFLANFSKDADEASQYKVGFADFNKPTDTRKTIKMSSDVPDSASNSNLYCGYYTTKAVRDFVYRQNSDNSYGIITNIKKYLSSFPYSSISSENYDEVYNTLNGTTYSGNLKLGMVLFPGFVKTYEWAPTGVDASNEEIGKGKWYIPSAQEYSFLIREKLRQIDDGTRVGEDHINEWNSSGVAFYSGQNLKNVKANDNVFKTLLTNMKATTLDAFQGLNIEFIKNALPNLKSSTFGTTTYNDAKNDVFVYQSLYNGSTQDTSWTATINSYQGAVASALSERAIIYPCCRIIKTIDLS